MSGTDVVEFTLTGGQNEGTDLVLLQPPEMSYVQNARQRKAGRWGKRYGTTQIASAFGNGTGNVRQAGKGFCVVDDVCQVWDQASSTWISPAQYTPKNITSPNCQAPRVPGAISGWVTDIAYYPGPTASAKQNQTACSVAYGLNYLWTAYTFIDPNNITDQVIRVVATNPTDQTLVLLSDIYAANAGLGGVLSPRLFFIGNTLVLTYQHFMTGFTGISGQRLQTVAAGFTARVNIVASTGAYDASPYSSTQFLLAVATATATADERAYIVTTFPLAIATTSIAGPSPGDASISIVGNQGLGVIYLMSGVAGQVSSFNAALSTVSSVTITAPGISGNYSLAGAILPSGNLRAALGTTFQIGGGTFIDETCFCDVTPGAVISGFVLQQTRSRPISRPFMAGSQCYLWVMNQFTLSSPSTTLVGVGYATLIRLPASSEYALQGSSYINCPIEMLVNDFLACAFARDAVPFFDTNNVPTPTQLGINGAFAFVYPALTQVPTFYPPTSFQRFFRVVQAKQNSAVLSSQLAVAPIVSDAATFLPFGALTRVGKQGANEEGFILAPRILQLNASVTAGNLSAGTYEYCITYRAITDRGLTETSAPSVAASVAPGASLSANVLIEYVSLTARSTVFADIYRTLANGSVFYYVASIPVGISGTYTIFNDGASDAAISASSVLYTQVGGELPNSAPPPCRFGVAGGGRVFLSGLLRGDVVQCSKPILGDEPPTWADNDAFRIVLPSKVTGLAWMDNLVIFTDEGVYVVSGDGPDNSGTGSFSVPSRMPFPFGCIEPRSVVTTDDGTWFQTNKTLALLPRGFGPVVMGGTNIEDSLANFPVISGTTQQLKQYEHCIHWNCLNDQTGNGIQLVYDTLAKCWSVDTITDPFNSSTSYGFVSIGQWFGGELIYGLKAQNFVTTSTAFSDSIRPITMQLNSGYVRPFGTLIQGVISRLLFLIQQRLLPGAVAITVGTDQGLSSGSTTRTLSTANGDGAMLTQWIDVELGNAELRRAASLFFQLSESSANEGVVFNAFAVEHEKPEGLFEVGPGSRSV